MQTYASGVNALFSNTTGFDNTASSALCLSSGDCALRCLGGARSGNRRLVLERLVNYLCYELIALIVEMPSSKRVVDLSFRYEHALSVASRQRSKYAQNID